MDIEAIRKLNNLTGALRNHSTNISSEDALRQAETILQPLTEKTQIHQTEEKKNEPTKNSEALLERKYQLLLEMNNKRFEQSLATLHENISVLTQEISRLKTELSTRTTPPIEPAPLSPSPPDHVHQPEPVLPKKENHPRQGAFAPGDISIEKMFYFGGGKR